MATSEHDLWQCPKYALGAAMLSCVVYSWLCGYNSMNKNILCSKLLLLQNAYC